MPHVLVGGQIHASGIALLEAADGISFDYLHEVSEQSVAGRIADAEALVIRTQPLGAATVARAPRLRIVSRHGVGYDSVDVAALDARGITLAVVDDVNSRSVAEHAMMLVLASAKRLGAAGRAVREGDWAWRNRLAPGELWGKRLLILGYGRIGRHLARIAHGFGMEIVAFDPYLERAGWPEGPVPPAGDLHRALSEADVVSVHVPKGDKPLIGRAEIARMRAGAVIVNTSRGGIIDETALAEAIREGRLAGAGLDVFDTEPPGAETAALMQMDEVIATPHVAGLTAECGERMAISCVRNVLDFFEGTLDHTLVVNRKPPGQVAT
jgi:D-3-phosphoglycerate dehydrogenase